jgi:MoaA/NifB/PqqE/SkfB family radical SAM enzyme
MIPIKIAEEINSLAELSSAGLELDLITAPSVRGKLDTGPFCNYDCEFCYYGDQLDVKIPFELVKQRADHLLSYGIKQADLSGGESSVSPDWFKILDYCNERFEHVSCLSHGGKFSNIEFLQESKDHGLKEILFSLHGATAETHDAITRRKGSFTRILKAINNAKELDIIVRINCTVYYKNYHQLENIYAGLINNISPLEVNFITLNYWDNVDVNNVTYQAMTTNIKRCIDILNKDMIINVRYVPYCYMEGYEKYVCDQYQHIYDIYDWNKEMYSYSLDVSKPYSNEEKIQNAYNACKKFRARFYSKKVECIKCKHFYICDGVEKEVADANPVYPVVGEKIKQVNFYRKDHFK